MSQQSPDPMSDEPDPADVDPVVQAIHKLLVGRPHELQGPILADLLATWLVGHFSDDRRETERMREQMLTRHVHIVRTLMPINEAVMLTGRQLH